MTQRVSGSLEIRDGETCCTACGTALGPADRNWKHGAAVREQPMNDAGGAPYQSGAHVLLRLFFCPGCGRQLGAETAMKDDPFLEDVVRA